MIRPCRGAGTGPLTSLQQRLAGQTCALLLAAIARRAAHTAALWQHAENDRGAATAGRVIDKPGETANRALKKHPRGKCRRRGRLGRARPAPQLRRTAKTSRTTTQKGPARLAVD